MRTASLLGVLALLAGSLPAQSPKASLVFTQRFDGFSLDPNGGSLNRIREFDLGFVTPGPGAAARSWLPTTGFSALLGDSHADGNYTRFHGWKTTYERFNFHGLFVKYADRMKGDPRLVYFTTRDNAVNKKFLVFTNGGSQTHQVVTGDYLRLLPNGHAEFFVTQAQIMKAAGNQPGSYAPGASALCQDDKGNLYFSPAEGGVWVGGVWLNDGGIAMIEAADITYDALGNVQDIGYGKAFVILGEIATGPNGQPNIRQYIAKAAALDYNGTPISTTANLCGLALDPNGGTFTSSFPHPSNPNLFPTVPNLIFGGDSGGWAGTIFSTANLGSIAVINGVTMGTQTGFADGSWAGFKADKANFSPTFMGFTVIDEVPDLFTADAANDGAILSAHTTVDIDLGYMRPGTPLFLFLAPGPFGAGKFVPAFDMTGLLGAASFNWVFLMAPPVLAVTLGPADTNGYGRFSVPKPTDPGLIGAALVFQAGRINTAPPLVSLSNPVVMQFK